MGITRWCKSGVGRGRSLAFELAIGVTLNEIRGSESGTISISGAVGITQNRASSRGLFLDRQAGSLIWGKRSQAVLGYRDGKRC